MKEVNINVENGIKEIVIREGNAAAPVERKPYSFTGQIGSCMAHFKHMLRMLPPVVGEEYDEALMANEVSASLQAVYGDVALHVSENDMSIEMKLLVGIGFDTVQVVTGVLTVDPVLSELKINSNHEWSAKQLSSVIKKNRILFDDKEKAMEIVAQLRQVNAQVNANLEKQSDDRGNKRDIKDQQVTSNVLDSFVLNCPLFKGAPNERFLVEVCLDVRNNEVFIWLESVELIELQREMVSKVRDQAYQDFSPYMPVLVK